jgi:hypothetical protein
MRLQVRRNLLHEGIQARLGGEAQSGDVGLAGGPRQEEQAGQYGERGA